MHACWFRDFNRVQLNRGIAEISTTSLTTVKIINIKFYILYFDCTCVFFAPLPLNTHAVNFSLPLSTRHARGSCAIRRS